MDSRPRRNTLAVLVVALVAVVLVSGFPLYAVSPSPDESATEASLVQLGESGPYVWPYTASGPTFEQPVSPVNVVFATDPATVQTVLTTRSLDTWNVSDPRVGAPQEPHFRDDVPWQTIDSRPRYVYATIEANESGTGTWRPPVYQLHSGDYFGSQLHLRVYDGSTTDQGWTIVQAHAEHWDWFTLTHHVDSHERARERIEESFVESDRVTVERRYYGNRDSFDADGWTTIVRLSGLLLVPAGAFAGSALRRERDEDYPTVRRLALFLSMGAVVLGVRAAGIGTELIGLDPKVVSKVLYVVLIFGAPLAAAGLSHRLPAPDAFALAGGGFAIAVVADFMFLSVTVLPLEIVVHRLLAAVALGFLAAGVAILDRSSIGGNGFLLAGASLWAVAIALPLL